MTPQITILGGGAAGWMTAAGLARALGGKGRIRLVETADAAPAGLAEAAPPSVRAFNDRLGIDENELVRRTGATFGLGSELTGWAGPGSRFFQPFGSFGSAIGTVGFHHAWLRLRALGEGGEIEAYCLAAAAAARGRFQRPSRDPGSVLASFDYSLHLDLDAYVEVLRERAMALGVASPGPRLRSVELRGEDGFVEALELEDGERVAADLFVDCTDDGRLIGGALGVGWRDWSGMLPCDRMATASAEPADDPAPFARIDARPGGWRWRMALQDRVVSGRTYCSARLSDEAAIEECGGTANIRHFRNGRRESFWTRNCVAIGAASGSIEALAPTRLHLIQSGVERLAALLPNGVAEAAETAEFDRLSIEELERARDFVALHHHLRAGGSETAVPDELAHRIAAFRSRARVVAYGGESFLTQAWLAALLGLGVRPGRYHPFADGLDADELRRALQAQRIVVGQAADSMPTHGDFIASHGLSRAGAS